MRPTPTVPEAVDRGRPATAPAAAPPAPRPASPAPGPGHDGTPPLLSVRGLRTYFELDEGTVRAVDGVSCDVYPGRVLGVVGESGCGKSILMKSVLRIVERPGRIVAGQILFRPERATGLRVDGDGYVDLAQLDPRRRRMRRIRGGEIALIPQEPMSAFSPLHTIGDQIVEAIRLHSDVGRREARRIAIEKLREVGLPSPEQRVDAYSWQLSGGLRQRAIIAMALSCNPRLLIADEPTTAVDVTTQAQILELIKDLQVEHDAAIVFITHDLGVIAQLADDVVVMYLGKVMETGPVDDIFHAPKHPYTRALLRSIPSVDSVPRVSLPTISGSIPHPFNRPRGCPFHPRCPDVMPGRCDVDTPAMVRVGGDVSVACFLHHDVSEAP